MGFIILVLNHIRCVIWFLAGGPEISRKIVEWILLECVAFSRTRSLAESEGEIVSPDTIVDPAFYIRSADRRPRLRRPWKRNNRKRDRAS